MIYIFQEATKNSFPHQPLTLALALQKASGWISKILLPCSLPHAWDGLYLSLYILCLLGWIGCLVNNIINLGVDNRSTYSLQQRCGKALQECPAMRLGFEKKARDCLTSSKSRTMWFPWACHCFSGPHHTTERTILAMPTHRDCYVHVTSSGEPSLTSQAWVAHSPHEFLHPSTSHCAL